MYDFRLDNIPYLYMIYHNFEDLAVLDMVYFFDKYKHYLAIYQRKGLISSILYLCQDNDFGKIASEFSFINTFKR